MSLNFYFNLVRRWLWLLVLAPLVAGATTFWVNRQQPRFYEASVRLVIGPGIDSPNPGVNDLRAGGQLMHTYAEVATTRPFLQSISDSLGLRINPDQLVSEITVTPNDNAQILTIRVQDRDPAQAATIANAVADGLVRLSPFSAGGSGAQIHDQMRAQAAKLQSNIDSMEARIKQLEAEYQAAEAAIQAPIPADLKQKVDATNALLDQLEADLVNARDLTKQRLILDMISFERSRLADLQNNDPQVQHVRDTLNQLTQERTRLDNAHQTLALLQGSLQATSTNQVKLLESAAAGKAVPSQIQLKMLMGSAAGFIMALTLALAAEYFNDTIRAAEDLAHATGAPVLGTIFKHAAWWGNRRGRLVVRAMPTSRVAEAYRLLSTKLLFSNPNTPTLHSILISSAQDEDNTSEIAANMAVTLAQTGTRVILVDADLRRPAIAQLFDIADGRSLTDVLANPSEPTELTTFDWAPGLSVLPGDPVPSNAFELLASPRMVTLIEQLKGQADILIIAAAPLLSHADSLILASHVDGVLFVARKGLIRRKVINNAMEHLRSLGAHVVGIVFNDSHRAPVHVALGRQAGDLVSRSSGDTLAIGRSLGPQMKSRRNGRHTAGQGVSSETVTLASVPDRDRAALELLDAISREFAVQLDLRDLLPRVLRLTLEAVGASSGSIMVLDEKGEVIEGVVAYAGEVRREDAPNLTDTVARGLAGWVITHRQAALIPNTRDDPRWLSRSWADSDSTSRSAISVPLLSCDRVMGVLTLGHPQPGLFTEGDLSLLTAVSTHISFNADQPTAEDASFPETVISGPTAGGEMSGDSPLTRPADDPAEARSVATASLETR